MPSVRWVCTVTMKLMPVAIVPKPAMNTPSRGQRDVGIRVERGIGRVERPAGIDAPEQERRQRQHAAAEVEIPRHQVQPRKGYVTGANRERQNEVAERRGHRRDKEEPDHDHAVQREQAVVGIGGDEVTRRRGQLDPHQRCRRAADDEEGGYRGEVEDGDALVVRGEQPGPYGVAVAEKARRERHPGAGLGKIGHQSSPPSLSMLRM